MKKIIVLTFVVALFTNCSRNPNTVTLEKTKGLIVDKAMVVSAREEASKIGVEVMRLGGNAFDAMIATDLALLVAYPVAGNIGGGGFMVFRMNDGSIGALDYRETAPLLATKNMFLDEKGIVDSDKSKLGALAIGVPGTIAGLFEIHSKFGTLSFDTLIQPAIDLAKKGIVVTEAQVKRLNRHKKSIYIKQ